MKAEENRRAMRNDASTWPAHQYHLSAERRGQAETVASRNAWPWLAGLFGIITNFGRHGEAVFSRG